MDIVATVPEMSTMGKKTQIQCGLCNLWFHQKCTGLSDNEIQFLGKTSDKTSIHWFCNPCEILSKPILTRLTKIESTMSSLDERVSKIEALDQKIATIEAKVNQSAQHPSRAESDEKLTGEITERIKRANNAVIYGVAESTNEGEDKQRIQAILSKLEVDTRIQLRRLGRHKSAAGARPRPVLIELTSEKEKWSLIKKTNNPESRQSNEMNGISVKPDQTKSQREADFKLRQELKERRSRGENNIIIRRGQIVKAQPKNY